MKHSNFCIKIFIFSFLLSFLMISSIFAADVRMQLSYGINNQAKSGLYLPLNITLDNRENADFAGYILVKVYENNESIYKYKQNISINKKDSVIKYMNISVSSRNNTIIVELYDEDDKLQSNERINIDLETLSNRLLIGLLSDTPNRLMYLDDLQLKNGNIRTKVVEINTDEFELNRNMLSQLDCIFISDIDSNRISDGLNLAIENFIKDGKVVFLGTGGVANSIPKAFQKFLFGPTIEEDIKYNLNNYVSTSDKKNNIILPSTKYKFVNNVLLYGDDENSYISNLNIGTGILCNCMFSFNDIDEYIKNNKGFIVKLIEDVFGDARLNYISNINDNVITNDYYNIRSIIDTVDNENLPNIFYYIMILAIYLFIVTIVLYAILRGVNQVKNYPIFVGVLAVIFSLVFYFVLKQNRKTGTFLTYSSIVEFNNDANNRETAFLNFRTLDRKDYSFSTSNNNTLHPMMKNITEPIVVDDDNTKNQKSTMFEIENNIIYVSVENAKNFDPSIFMYQNKNIDLKIYDVDASINIFDGSIDGRVTNKMKYDIKDASIISQGKIIYIGDIAPETSITLKNAKVFNAPINNNNMISELMCYYPRTKIAKYFLENNINTSFNNYMLVGFVSNVNSIDCVSDDINEMKSETMIVKYIENKNNDKLRCDISSLKHKVINISGVYDDMNNTIDGDNEVVNTYTFDKNVDIEKIYFENITDYDVGRIDYNVAFYGNVYVYNNITNQYDQVFDGVIDNNINQYVDNNSIICRFTPTNRDILYRKISLPHIRAVGIKNDKN